MFLRPQRVFRRRTLFSRSHAAKIRNARPPLLIRRIMSIIKVS